MDTVTDYAESCRQRVFMGGFHGGTINNDGAPFHLGTTECAIVESALRAIERSDSLVIHNPFPTTALPIAIIASYAYSQNPGIPGNEGLPMLVFPATSRGYLGKIDKFHFQTTVSSEQNKTPLIPRYPLNALSEQGESWGVYTANSGFEFDHEAHDAPLGSLFVDLQKPEWSERYFNAIEQFCEEHPDVPVIFYTDEMVPAAELTCGRLNVDPLRVTNRMLAQVPPAEAVKGESNLTVQERVLTGEDVTIYQYPVVDGGVGSLISDFIGLKNKCLNRDFAYMEVSQVFNRLLKQPFKPRYWSRVVGGSAFYEDVPGYIERIENRASHINEGSDLLYNFARAANELQGYLNDKHVLQNTVLDAIVRAGDDKMPSRFVVKNTAEVDALKLALTDSGYTIPSSVEIIERAKVMPMPEVRYVFLYPPYRDDYVFEFPPSKEVAYTHNALWSNYVRASAVEATENIGIQYVTRAITAEGTVGGVDDFVFDIDTLETDIEGYLRRTAFGGPDSDWESSASTERGGETPDLVLTLADGQHLALSARSIVTSYDADDASITRKQAKNVGVGDEVLLIGSVAGDLYDVLLESAHKREAVREDERLVENWRTALETAIERDDLSYSEVVAELQDRGSDIQSWQTVKAWANGRYIGPLNEGDCRRVLLIARPEIEGVLLEQIHEQVWRAMKHLRLLHRRIGRNVRRAVEAEYNAATSTAFRGGVNERMIKNIAREMERATVTSIERTDATAEA